MQHGVLTYALPEALTQKPGDAGEVKVGMLADHVDEREAGLRSKDCHLASSVTRQTTRGNSVPYHPNSLSIRSGSSPNRERKPSSREGAV
jgi:hypothetical protein